MDKEKELEQREKALEEREKNLEKKEKELGFFSQAVKAKKESWYDRINVSVKTMDRIIWGVAALLTIVVILIILEATGVLPVTAELRKQVLQIFSRDPGKKGKYPGTVTASCQIDTLGNRESCLA